METRDGDKVFERDIPSFLYGYYINDYVIVG
jgi:hypothetical protein